MHQSLHHAYLRIPVNLKAGLQGEATASPHYANPAAWHSGDVCQLVRHPPRAKSESKDIPTRDLRNRPNTKLTSKGSNHKELSQQKHGSREPKQKCHCHGIVTCNCTDGLDAAVPVTAILSARSALERSDPTSGGARPFPFTLSLSQDEQTSLSVVRVSSTVFHRQHLVGPILACQHVGDSELQSAKILRIC